MVSGASRSSDNCPGREPHDAPPISPMVRHRAPARGLSRGAEEADWAAVACLDSSKHAAVSSAADILNVWPDSPATVVH